MCVCVWACVFICVVQMCVYVCTSVYAWVHVHIWWSFRQGMEPIFLSWTFSARVMMNRFISHLHPCWHSDVIMQAPQRQPLKRQLPLCYLHPAYLARWHERSWSDTWMPSRMCLTLKRPQLVYQWISSAMTTQTMLGNGTYLCMPRLAAQDHKTRPVVTDTLGGSVVCCCFPDQILIWGSKV